MKDAPFNKEEVVAPDTTYRRSIKPSGASGESISKYRVSQNTPICSFMAYFLPEYVKYLKG
jgi:hypothetical protein